MNPNTKLHKITHIHSHKTILMTKFLKTINKEKILKDSRKKKEILHTEKHSLGC